MFDLLGEATTALRTTQLACSTYYGCFALEGNVFLVILVVNQADLLSPWQFASIISNISLDLSFFQKLKCIESV